MLKNQKLKKESVGNEQIASELDIHDAMIITLAEMLEEKGQLDYQAMGKEESKRNYIKVNNKWKTAVENAELK